MFLSTNLGNKGKAWGNLISATGVARGSIVSLTFNPCTALVPAPSLAVPKEQGVWNRGDEPTWRMYPVAPVFAAQGWIMPVSHSWVKGPSVGMTVQEQEAKGAGRQRARGNLRILNLNLAH